MQILNINHQDFIAKYWQKKKLFDTLKINPIEKGFIISADTIVSLKKKYN